MKHLIAVLVLLAALVSSAIGGLKAGGDGSDGTFTPTGVYEEWIEV